MTYLWVDDPRSDGATVSYTDACPNIWVRMLLDQFEIGLALRAKQYEYSAHVNAPNRV